MDELDDPRRKEARQALINLALLEGLLFAVVVAVYFYTRNMTYLVGGLVGAMLIFGPVWLRFFKAHGRAFKSSNSKRESEND